MNSYGSGRGPSRPSGSGPSGRDRAAPRGPDPQFEDLLQKADLRNPSASLFDTDAEAIAPHPFWSLRTVGFRRPCPTSPSIAHRPDAARRLSTC